MGNEFCVFLAAKNENRSTVDSIVYYEYDVFGLELSGDNPR